MSDKTYDGPVVFVDGVHYPATNVEDHEDGERTHADLDRPLRWVEGTTYRYAEDDEPLHGDVHHLNNLEIVFPDDSQITVSPDEAEDVKQFLAERRGES